MLPTERGQTPPPSFSACFCGFVSVGEFFGAFRGCDHSITLIYIYSRDTFKILGSAFTFKIHLRFGRDWCWFVRTVTATASASDIPEFRQYLRFERFLTIYAYPNIDITRKSDKSKIWHISVESLKRSCYNFFGKLGAFRFSSLPTDKSLLFCLPWSGCGQQRHYIPIGYIISVFHSKNCSARIYGGFNNIGMLNHMRIYQYLPHICVLSDFLTVGA